MKKKNRIIMWAAILCLTVALCVGCGASSSEPKETPAASEVDDGAKSGEAAGTDDSAKADENAKPNDSTETLETSASDVDSIVGVQELVGDVQEIGEGRFVIAKAELEEDENGGQIMASSTDPDKESLVTVVYGDDTAFTSRTIYNGGARYEDADGSAADLTEGMLVELTGSYEGGEYHAKTVRLVTVV